jgi:putative Mg2+ transporter-C (MgtC) family protein
MSGFLDVTGQGWLQLAELTLAFVLSALVGVEREIRQKSAGLRTHTLVGVSAALIMLVSKYGFTDVLANGRIVLDPSRVAAQVVSGIGFIGGGVIFMRRDVVRGLTTAASVWLTAALGMACGAGFSHLQRPSAISSSCSPFPSWSADCLGPAAWRRKSKSPTRMAMSCYGRS